jgi:hypothetical protein
MRKIYAFVRSWTPDGDRLHLVRERLAATDTEMQVLSSQGVWTVRGDQLDFADQIAGDVMTEKLLCRVREGRDAVFVVDDHGALTYQQSWEAA